MSEEELQPEELITAMTPDEVCELLSELGLPSTPEKARALQQLVSSAGSIEAAFEMIAQMATQRRAA